jgi:hypothetical protein
VGYGVGAPSGYANFVCGCVTDKTAPMTAIQSILRENEFAIGCVSRDHLVENGCRGGCEGCISLLLRKTIGLIFLNNGKVKMCCV